MNPGKLTLAKIDFNDLNAGMKFLHPQLGMQVILDLGRGQFGPTIKFHNCQVFNGEIPQFDLGDEENNLFTLISQSTYPSGSENWEYLGLASQSDLDEHGWFYFQVNCPHCGYEHRFLAFAPMTEIRNCRKCGMVFCSPAKRA